MRLVSFLKHSKILIQQNGSHKQKSYNNLFSTVYTRTLPIFNLKSMENAYSPEMSHDENTEKNFSSLNYVSEVLKKKVSAMNVSQGNVPEITDKTAHNENHRKSMKRKYPNQLGWLLAGCCFSKKNKSETSSVKEECDSLLPGIEPSLPSQHPPEEENSAVYDSLSQELDSGDICRTSSCLSVSVKAEQSLMTEQTNNVPCVIADRQDTDKNKEVLKSSKKTPTEKINKSAKEPDPDGSRKRPNYFVAVQVNDEKIHETLKLLQDCILEQKPIMKKAMISLPTLHITLAVMHISGPEDLQRAIDALIASHARVKTYLDSSSLHLRFQGLSSFGKKVLFVNLLKDDGHKVLMDVYEDIVSCFELHGFSVRERDTFEPHLTVAKLSKAPELRRKGLKAISTSWYEDYKNTDFGSQLVNSLQLLSMNEAHDDMGYYQCKQECFFRSPSTHLLSSSSEAKEEVRKKFRDLTEKKLLEKE